MANSQIYYKYNASSLCKREFLLLLQCAAIMLLSACSSRYSDTNVRLPDDYYPGSYKTRATLNISPDRGRVDTLFILALSGGGSRAAYWSTSVMFKLVQLIFGNPTTNLLAEVDAISSVSGGSMAAAYYAISTDMGDPPMYGRVWKEKKVKTLMGKNYIKKWFGNWFWPTNIAKFWFTAYDRTDIMAQTFADNLYDKRPFGRDLTLGDLNTERPYLILNATDGTRGKLGDPFTSEPFTFTKEDFGNIKSDINDYELSRAVMATATFPAVFNFMTLKNYADSSEDKPRFTHVFDGGNIDNLGLKSVSHILKTLSENEISYKKLVVILVDAHTGDGGVSSEKPDPRNMFDFIIDTNFIDATDSLLAANRRNLLSDFEKKIRKISESTANPEPNKTIFYHIQFADLAERADLLKRLKRIKTNFKLKNGNASDLDEAAELLLTPENHCIQAIVELLNDDKTVDDPICTYAFNHMQ